MSDTRVISQIYTSRKIVLETLESQGYDISSYSQFSRNEVDSMFRANQLDMLLSQSPTSSDSGPSQTIRRSIYIKYHIDLLKKQKQIQKKTLDEIIEDLFVLENVLTKEDTLMVIVDVEPNASTLKHLTYLYDHQGIFVIVQNIKSLQFNLLKHEKVPPMTILTEDEAVAFRERYNVKDLSQLPELSRYDPVAKVMCMRPGQIGRIERNSPTSLVTHFYRVCIND
jgi:DNA-directed RNA polymerase subunit H (RpoH/RPB5)